MEYSGISLFDYPEIFLLKDNNNSNFSGVYFIGVENNMDFRIIYIGQSTSNIGSRLDYHYLSFYGDKSGNYDWHIWMDEAKLDISEIFYFYYQTNVSIQIESIFIDYTFSGKFFPLNIQHNRIPGSYYKKLIPYKEIKYPNTGYDWDDIKNIIDDFQKNTIITKNNLQNNINNG